MTSIPGSGSPASHVHADRSRAAASPDEDRPIFRQKDRAQAPRPASPASASGAESLASSERPGGPHPTGFRQQVQRLTSTSDHPIRSGLVQLRHNLDVTARDVIHSVGIPIRPAPQEVRITARYDRPVRTALRHLGYDLRVTALDVGISARQALAGRGERHDRPVTSRLAEHITGLFERRETQPSQAAQAVPLARPATSAPLQQVGSRLEPMLMVQARSPAEVQAMEREQALQAMQAARVASQPLPALLPPLQQQIPLAPPPPSAQHRSPAMSLNEQVRLLPDVPDEPVGSPVLPDVPGTSPLATPIITRH
jgi:hypothetical protein